MLSGIHPFRTFTGCFWSRFDGGIWLICILQRSFLLTHNFFSLMGADLVLIVLFSISPRAWLLIVLWFVLLPIARQLDLGPLYVSSQQNTVCFAPFLVVYRKFKGQSSVPHQVLIKCKCVQIITTVFAVMFSNLGKRQPGEARYDTGSPSLLSLSCSC